MRILWADDQRDVAKTLSSSLDSKNKHHITFADNGNQALQLLETRVFDIAILDLRMPPGTWGGLWVLEQLREMRHRIPVLVLSGEGKQPETIKALRLGAHDFVTKEQASSELGDRIDALLHDLWTDIHKEVLTSFPSPLALSYKRHITSTTPQAQMRTLFDIYEQALRLAGLVGLAEAGEQQLSLPVQTFMQLARPSIGTWHGLIQLLLKTLPSDAAMVRFWRAIDEPLMPEIIKTRNDVAHGYEFAERKARSWLSVQEPVLRSWLARLWQQLSFRIFLVLSSGYDGRTMLNDARVLEGESPVLPKLAGVSADRLILRHAYILKRHPREHVTPLNPLMVLDYGEELNTWRAYLFDGWKANRNGLTGDEPLRHLELWAGARSEDREQTINTLPPSLWKQHPSKTPPL